MLLGLIIVLAALLLIAVISLVQLNNIRLDMQALESDVNQIRRAFIPPNVGGRAAPSSAELAAARARAPVSIGAYPPNQVDASGMAQIGGSPPKT